MEHAAKFATTRWSLVHRIDSAVEGQAALEELCRAYWLPIYHFVRQSGHDHPTAEDLTQSFFAHLLQHDVLARADVDRGRFRTFLLAALNNFLTDDHRRNLARKRGGHVEFIHFDEVDANAPRLAGIAPETCFEQQWAASIVRQTLLSLEAEYQRTGRAARFQALRDYLLASPPEGRYAMIARDLNLTESTLRSTLQRMRQRFRVLFRLTVAETVADESQIDAEIRHLLDVL